MAENKVHEEKQIVDSINILCVCRIFVVCVCVCAQVHVGAHANVWRYKW